MTRSNVWKLVVLACAGFWLSAGVTVAHAEDDLKTKLTASPEIKAEVQKSIDAAQCAAAVSVSTSPDSPTFLQAMDRETDLRFVALHHAEKAVKLAQEQHKYVDGYGLFSPYAFDLGINYDAHGIAAYAVMGEYKDMVAMLDYSDDSGKTAEDHAKTFYKNAKCSQIFAEKE